MTHRLHPDESTHDEMRRLAMEELATQLVVAESAIADGRGWLGGDTWTVADAYFLWCWQRALQSGCNRAHWPHLSRWEKRAEAHPAWRLALQREAQTAGKAQVACT